MEFSIEEIKQARDNGHQIDSLIKLFEKKMATKSSGKHWYVFKDGRNGCEFCGALYHFSNEQYCNSTPSPTLETPQNTGGNQGEGVGE